jgi:AcrR family transcriptional regulator
MAATVIPDRRHRRRGETIEQVLALAVEVMSEQGVAGLTLGEVARRMGIRTPSLYVYFDGKNALYDALFHRGWTELLAELRAKAGQPLADLPAATEIFVRWSVEHPGYAPLMYWRPIPGFTPSQQAYAPAVEAVQEGRKLLARLQADGALRQGVDLERAWRTWTALAVGIVTQQLANAPGEPYETGAFTSTLPELVAMWLTHYEPDQPGLGGQSVPRTRN